MATATRTETGFPVFNAEYVNRLKDSDAATEQHFVSYFSTALGSKLRGRLRADDAVEDIRQETLLRVLRTVRSGDGLEHPERFGAFVHAVCNNVMLEHLRAKCRYQQIAENAHEPADDRQDPDSDLIEEQRRRWIRAVIARMGERDRKLLSMILFEGKNKEQVCATLGVTRDHCRLLLHRAKIRFQELAAGRKKPAPAGPVFEQMPAPPATRRAFVHAA